MRVAMIWHCVYPWDIRMEKWLKLLSQNGYDVNLICRGQEGLPEKEKDVNGSVYRVNVPFLPHIRALRFLSYPFFFNPLWVIALLKSVVRNQADLIIVRDLPLAILAGVIGKVLKIPVFFDMAENYPAALMAYSKARYKPFLFLNGFLPRLYERWSLGWMDKIFVVAEEQKSRLLQLGVSEDRVICVLNTPDLDFFNKIIENTDQEDGENGLNLLYVGKIDHHRGVHLLVQAMPEIIRHCSRARLKIVGDGTERKKLKGLISALGLNQSVVLEGWVKFDRVPGLIRESTVCLIPHLRSEHTDTTLPNKIFDYMALGKPVITSNCRPLERIVREEKCGLLFNSGDSLDLSAKVIRLLSDRQREAYGSNGRKAVEEKYNWAVDSQRILQVLDGRYGIVSGRATSLSENGQGS